MASFGDCNGKCDLPALQERAEMLLNKTGERILPTAQVRRDGKWDLWIKKDKMKKKLRSGQVDSLLRWDSKKQAESPRARYLLCCMCCGKNILNILIDIVVKGKKLSEPSQPNPRKRLRTASPTVAKTQQRTASPSVGRPATRGSATSIRKKLRDKLRATVMHQQFVAHDKLVNLFKGQEAYDNLRRATFNFTKKKKPFSVLLRQAVRASEAEQTRVANRHDWTGYKNKLEQVMTKCRWDAVVLPADIDMAVRHRLKAPIFDPIKASVVEFRIVLRDLCRVDTTACTHIIFTIFHSLTRCPRRCSRCYICTTICCKPQSIRVPDRVDGQDQTQSLVKLGVLRLLPLWKQRLRLPAGRRISKQIHVGCSQNQNLEKFSDTARQQQDAGEGRT